MVLDRYIGKSVLSGAMLASFVMLSIFAFVDYVNQLNYVGTGDYGALQAAIFVFMRLPQRLYELSPSILLLGGILSMGGLAANSELIVMRASGITTMRITRSVLQTGFIIAIMVALLGEYVVPDATRGAKTFRAEMIEKKLIIGGMNDIWARDGNRYVNVKRILPDRQLSGVTVYELNEQHQLVKTTYADEAQYQDDRWILNDVRQSDIGFDGVTTSTEERITLERLILLELFSVLELESKDMSATELMTYSNYLEENKLDNDEVDQSILFFFQQLHGNNLLPVVMDSLFTESELKHGKNEYDGKENEGHSRGVAHLVVAEGKVVQIKGNGFR